MEIKLKLPGDFSFSTCSHTSAFLKKALVAEEMKLFTLILRDNLFCLSILLDYNTKQSNNSNNCNIKAAVAAATATAATAMARHEDNDQFDRDDDGDDHGQDNDEDDNDDDDVDVNEQEESEFKVCEGLTEEERREIRKSQRKLRNEIPDLDVDDARNKNNQIFKKVKYIREAVLDSENVDEIAKKAASKVDQLIQIPRYDADRIVSKLIEACQVKKGNGNSFFNWHALGVQAGICFNAAPSNVSFLNGPLLDGKEELHVKQRAKRPRLQISEEEKNAKEERPEDIQGHTKRGADQLSAVEQNIIDVSTALEKKVNRRYIAHKKKLKEKYGSGEKIPSKVAKKLKKHNGACAVELLFNPKSFTQTVENMFHYSFLVKQGTAQLDVRESKVVDEGLELDGGPIARYTTENQIQSQPPHRQAIVSLTMKDWRDMIKAYDVKESDVPHREGSIHEKRTSRK